MDVIVQLLDPTRLCFSDAAHLGCCGQVYIGSLQSIDHRRGPIRDRPAQPALQVDFRSQQSTHVVDLSLSACLGFAVVNNKVKPTPTSRVGSV